MSHALLESVTKHFAGLDDPRRETANRRHEFVDILTIALCAVIGIDPNTFETCFVAWVAALAQSLPGAPVVAIDGKTLRRSHDRANGGMATHIVSAYANASSLVLGQVATADESNEITAIPTLLDMLALDAALVTIDAMGCQTAIAEKIVDRGADYLLAVKANQRSLSGAIRDAFEDVDTEHFGKPVEQQNIGHGRIEKRRCWVCSDPEVIEPLSTTWKGIRSLVVIDSERTVVGGERTTERHHYIGSRAATATFFLEARREHWSVENGLHWVLDVAFREDESRVRAGDGAENPSVLRRMALNLLKREKTHKGGIEAKRCRAGWDETYMETVLAGLHA